jgi:chorismate mutase
MDIADWRTRIDQLDEQIVALLSERAAAAVAIGQIKRQTGAPIYEPNREENVFAHVRRINPGPLTAAQLQDIYDRVMDVMRALQRVESPEAAASSGSPEAATAG